MLFASVFLLSACSAEGLLQAFYDVMFPTTDTTQEEPEPTDPIIQNPTTPSYPVNLDSPIVTNESVVSNLAFSGTTLSWTAISEQTEYVVVYYSNSVNPTAVVVSGNAFNLGDLLSVNNEIYGVRVGIENEAEEFELSSVMYYNPDSYAPYTSSVYYFDGNLGDRYIENQTEFNQFAHYSFIYRYTSVDLKFEESYYESINMSTAITEAYSDSFLETISLSYSYSIINATSEIVRLTLDYRGADEPTLTLLPTYNQDTEELPYYETVSYSLRATDYDEFATDSRVVTAPVSTGEELFWAVEAGATPVFADTNNNGYRLYEKAKTVLRQIISDDMTDEEKLLSIFDYIAFNSVYDYEIVSTEFADNHTEPYMKYTSFYLEGVLDEGLAVCDGFSKTFSLFANMEGIQTVRIVGYVSGGGHAWNKVYLDGAWYVVDVTWTELTMNHYETGEPTEYLSRGYFLVSDLEISSTHTPDESQAYKNYSAPNNYYYYANTTFVYDGSTYDLVIDTQSDAVALLNYLWENYQAGNTVTSMDVTISYSVLQNWGTIVKAVKNAYNLTHTDRFDNDVLRVVDSYAMPYDSVNSGYASVVQVLDTFLNLEENS